MFDNIQDKINDYALYSERKDIFQLMSILLEELIKKMPDDPIEYMIRYLKSVYNPNKFSIIINGTYCSGKNLVAGMFSEMSECTLISLQKVLTKDNEQSQAILSHYESTGEFQDEEITKLFWNEVNSTNSRKHGWIIVGYPQTYEQAQLLVKYNIIPKHYFSISLDVEELEKRWRNRCFNEDQNVMEHESYDYNSDVEIDQTLTEDSELNFSSICSHHAYYENHRKIIESIFLKSLHTINGNKFVTNILEDMWTYVSKASRSFSPSTARIVILGPRGNGAGTCARFLSEKYDLKLIDMRFYEFPTGSLDGIHQNVFDQINTVQSRTFGYVLIGYPSTAEEAGMFLQKCGEPSKVIMINVSYEEVLYRLTALGPSDDLNIDHAPWNEEDYIDKKYEECINNIDEMMEVFGSIIMIDGHSRIRTVLEEVEKIAICPKPGVHDSFI